MAPSTSGKRWAQRLAPAALLFVIVAGFYWKLTLTRQFTWTRGPDLAEQVLPWFQVQAREWHAGRFPLWDPYLWGGQSLFGQAQPGAAYPLNWLLFLFPLDAGGHFVLAALNWYYVLIHFMAAAFAYLFCRDQGTSRPASLAGGIAFIFAGYLGNTDWPQMFNGAVWIPLVFLFQFRALHGRRILASAALSGMFVGIAFLSGHHQVPMFTALAWGLVWLWQLFQKRTRRLWGAVALALAIAALTSAFQTLPAFEYGRLARRWAGAPMPLEWNQSVPYAVHAHYDLKAFSLFGMVFPEIKMNFDPFVGVVSLTLALVAVAGLWRDPRVRLLAALALGALVYALGHNSVYQGLLYAITPDLDKARSPSAMVVVMQFAIAGLAAFGLDRRLSREAAQDAPLRWPRRVLIAFGAFTLAVCLFAILTNQLRYPGDDRVILTGAIALLLAALLRSRSPVPILVLLIFEMGNCAQYHLLDLSDGGQAQWLTALHANSDIADYLRNQPGFQRSEVAGDAFAPNWGAWHGVEMHGGNGASVPVNLLESEFFGYTGRRMWGVAYTLATAPEPLAGEEVFSGSSGLKVYRRDAFPRAWAVHELVQVPSEGAGNLAIGRDPEGYRHKANIIALPPAIESCAAPDRVELIEHAADRLAIRADMSCAGMVVLSDAFFPGWRARMDHAPVRIYEVNGAMRGVMVPAGSHTVTMRYRPWSVYAGAALSILGFAIALFVGQASGPVWRAKRAFGADRPGGLSY